MYCRESNPVRLSSQVSRSARLFRVACRTYRERPNRATSQRRKDRALAFLAMRAKAQYVATSIDLTAGIMAGTVPAPEGFDAIHTAGERYHAALAAWKGEYQTVLAV